MEKLSLNLNFLMEDGGYIIFAYPHSYFKQTIPSEVEMNNYFAGYSPVPVYKHSRYGYTLSEFANLDSIDLILTIEKLLKTVNTDIQNNLSQVLIELDKLLLKKFGISYILRRLLLMEAERVYFAKRKSYEQFNKYNVFDWESLDLIHAVSQKLCNGIVSWKEYVLNDKFQFEINLQAKIIVDKNSNMNICYQTDNIYSFLSMETMHIEKNCIIVKKCANCGKFFIPNKRSDEIYCDNIFIKDSGKTCKDIGYEIKLGKDVFRSAYRTAYKTQRARIKYNSHIPDYEEKHFKPWDAAAKTALLEYQEKNNIEGFKKWLKENKDMF